MNKKILAILLVIIILFGIFIYFSYFSNQKNENHEIKTTNNGSAIDFEGKEVVINGLTCMIPDSYGNGTIKKNSGIETYGTYSTDRIYVTVYDNSNKGDDAYQGDIDYFAYGIANNDNNPKKENITIANQSILYVTQHSNTRGDYRLVFFEVNGKKVLIEWLGSEITPKIENIIFSFYKLN